MYRSHALRTSSHLLRTLRASSFFSQPLRFCTSKPSAPDSEKVLYEEYSTPDGGKYRLDYNGQDNFNSDDWQKFERLFQLDQTPTDEEIDRWVETNSEDWEVVHLPSHLKDPDDTVEAEAPPDFDDFDEFEKPVRSVRELRQMEKFDNQRRDNKKKMQSVRALRLSREMEAAAVRGLDADGGGTVGGIEICRAKLSDNLRDLTIVFRSDSDDVEKHYDEMGKKVKAEIAQSMRTKFIPKVWFRPAGEEDQKRMELERLFERIAREKG
ncbi:Ribosome-binding factor A [Gracilaria domingensis]|nr:Ribosome-binding factor A [Gracilaria domingensis]